jgi:hypothetical protein
MATIGTTSSASAVTNANLDRIAEFYAARDQRTSASAIRSHERRRLRSSARAAAASVFAGIAVRSASTAWLSRMSTFFVSSTKRTCQRSAAPVYFSRQRRRNLLGLRRPVFGQTDDLR